MAVRFGPGGNSESFGKRKFPQDIAEYLKSFSLDCYEIECGRGVRISEATYANLPRIAKENDILITLHAPYFISLSSEKAETREKSVEYIMEAMRAADKLDAKKVVVHSGSCAKMTREEALLLAKDTVTKALKAMKMKGLSLNFTVNNVYVWTRYGGLDPDISSNQSSFRALDRLTYPKGRTYTLGLTANF